MMTRVSGGRVCFPQDLYKGAGWNFQTPCRVAVGVVGPPNFSGATGTYFFIKIFVLFTFRNYYVIYFTTKETSNMTCDFAYLKFRKHWCL
jgi:hypothetical protein